MLILPIALGALLYGGGYIAQFLYNYDVWQAAGGVFGTAPEFPDGNFFACIAAVFRWPYGLYGVGGCIAALAVLVFMVMRMGYSETGAYDRERNLIYSNKGTYGTAGFMTKKELKGVLDLVPNIRKHPGIILGEIDGEVICVPLKTRFNGNLAVYGASGSKKTRAFCMNMILQSAARKSSLVICDPKSELYEKSSAYLRDQGYTVKVFNLVTPAASDSWNCLSEIEGQELMAQLFCDVIIKNTGSERGDHFWDNAELNLLKALVLYVERGYPPEKRNIGEVYQLLAMSSEKELNAIFDVLDISHPAKAPYSIFKQSSESVRGGVIIGLGSRLQVFQNKDIRNITGYDEIDLELPGKQPCAYYCITSDQDSTWAYTTKDEHTFLETKAVTETVTVETGKKDLNTVLEQLAPSILYDDGEFTGELALDHTTITTEAAGYTTKSGKVIATKTIGPLDRNDMSYIPATTVKDGRTLTLANVEWQVIGTDLVGDVLAPSSYQAVATYSASTSSQVATGYVSTAEYKGTVTASGIESITYTVVYVGTEIVPEPPQPTEPIKQGGPLFGGNAAAIGGTLLVVLLLAALAGGVVWLYLHRKNVYVYVPGDQPRDYKLIAKFRVEPEKPEIQVNEDQIGSAHMLAVEIKKPLAKKLLNQIFTVNHPCGAQRYMVLRDNPSDWNEFPLDNHIEEMEEAT